MINTSLRRSITVLFTAGVLAITANFAAAEKLKTSAVDPQALMIFERASSFLAKQKQFSMSAEIWEDFVLENGNKIQFARTVKLELRRPDHFRATVATTQPERTFFYNGKSVIFLDQIAGFFGIVSAPSTITKTITAMEQDYNLTFPLDDLLMSNPYEGSAAKATSGQYFGIEKILGEKCHHMAFQHEQIDWQVWVEEGPVPVLRKLVLTQKQEEGSPQYTAIFKSWDFTTELPDYLFNFETTSDFRQIDMIESVPEKDSPSSQQ